MFDNQADVWTSPQRVRKWHIFQYLGWEQSVKILDRKLVGDAIEHFK